jgi:5'-nucleotidase
MHVGAECEGPGGGAPPEQESAGCRGELLEAVEQITEPVDLVLGGHTHNRVLTTVKGIPVAEAALYGTAYSVTDLERRGGRTAVTHRAVRTTWADEVSPDTAVARVVAEWEARVRPVSERVLVSFAAAMEREGSEYPLGNLVADAVRAQTGARVSLVNTGSVRRAMPAGPITYGMLYELQPFQNELVTVAVTGAQLRAALENALARDAAPDAHVSGMTVTYAPSAPRGSRVRDVRLADGRPLRDADTVTIGTTEFVATGGDGYEVLKEGRMTRAGVVDLDALVAYLRSLPQPVRPPAAGRWRTAGNVE